MVKENAMAVFNFATVTSTVVIITTNSNWTVYLKKEFIKSLFFQTKIYGFTLARVFNLFLGYLCTFDTIIEATTKNTLSNIGPTM